VDNYTLLEVSDKYSYYIYLTHQIYILGGFSVCAIVKNKIIAILIALVLIVGSAKILYEISNRFSRN